jgi:hypothetical protein
VVGSLQNRLVILRQQLQQPLLLPRRYLLEDGILLRGDMKTEVRELNAATDAATIDIIRVTIIRSRDLLVGLARKKRLDVVVMVVIR